MAFSSRSARFARVSSLMETEEGASDMVSAIASERAGLPAGTEEIAIPFPAAAQIAEAPQIGGPVTSDPSAPLGFESAYWPVRSGYLVQSTWRMASVSILAKGSVRGGRYRPITCGQSQTRAS